MSNPQEKSNADKNDEAAEIVKKFSDLAESAMPGVLGDLRNMLVVYFKLARISERRGLIVDAISGYGANASRATMGVLDKWKEEDAADKAFIDRIMADIAARTKEKPNDR